MSDTSSLADAQEAAIAGKRTSDQAGLNNNGTRLSKSVKRRASKACQCCRARKVRCNVVEQIPCTNCRLDEVECIISESKRKKKWNKLGEEEADAAPGEYPSARRASSIMSGPDMSQNSINMGKPLEHMPHALYQDLNQTMLQDSHRRHTFSNGVQTPQGRIDMSSLHNTGNGQSHMALPMSPPPSYQLPPYIKPLPSKIGSDDINYLSRKGALSIPPLPLRNALLKCFVEFVYPYMPHLDLHGLIESIDRNDGKNPVSLLLFQGIMFSGVATVGIKYLRAAGYTTRRDARRDFFQKTRLLYDFDYEVDRISLIQSLLLMTYWYETPDDQKDSHHWMGIAVSLSHTIGLHRNPERSNMDIKRQRLWKRIWWSTYMRDRLIALGMRRPTRIKNEDFDVPMLEIEDFEISTITPGTSSCMPSSCSVIQDAAKQRELAVLCIEKAKLCICISHVLSTQYSVLHNNHGVQSKEGSTRTTMMLVARKDDPEECGVRTCDEELRQWKAAIAPEAEYTDPSQKSIKSGEECMVLNKSLLHMVYYATLSALHRPQVLPSNAWPPQHTAVELLEISRANVRYAATEITHIAEMLSKMNLVRYLPTVGITVLLPAIIIHLLDIKAPEESTRRASLQGFCQCMQIMSKMRDIYAAADYSTAFLEAAIRKAEINLPAKASEAKDNSSVMPEHTASSSEPKHSIDALFIPASDDHHHDSSAFGNSNNGGSSHLTPPPDQIKIPSSLQSQRNTHSGVGPAGEDDLARRLNNFLASTPPDSDHNAETPFDQQQHHHSGGPSMHDLFSGGFGTGIGSNNNNNNIHNEDGSRSVNSSADHENEYGMQTADGGDNNGGMLDMDMADFEPDFDALVNLDAAGEAFALDDAYGW